MGIKRKFSTTAALLLALASTEGPMLAQHRVPAQRPAMQQRAPMQRAPMQRVPAPAQRMSMPMGRAGAFGVHDGRFHNQQYGVPFPIYNNFRYYDNAFYFGFNNSFDWVDIRFARTHFRLRGGIWYDPYNIGYFPYGNYVIPCGCRNWPMEYSHALYNSCTAQNYALRTRHDRDELPQELEVNISKSPGATVDVYERGATEEEQRCVILDIEGKPKIIYELPASKCTLEDLSKLEGQPIQPPAREGQPSSSAGTSTAPGTATEPPAYERVTFPSKYSGFVASNQYGGYLANLSDFYFDALRQVTNGDIDLGAWEEPHGIIGIRDIKRMKQGDNSIIVQVDVSKYKPCMPAVRLEENYLNAMENALSSKNLASQNQLDKAKSILYIDRVVKFSVPSCGPY